MCRSTPQYERPQRRRHRFALGLVLGVAAVLLWQQFAAGVFMAPRIRRREPPFEIDYYELRRALGASGSGVVHRQGDHLALTAKAGELPVGHPGPGAPSILREQTGERRAEPR